MANLVDVVAFLLQEYPQKEDLSNARVTKMVYLADWKHALQHGRQLTSIRWYFDNYGPFVWDVKDIVTERRDLFRTVSCANPYGSPKLRLEMIVAVDPRVSATERNALDHVIGMTYTLSYHDFIKLVYSTWPILASQRYSHLDLVRFAEQYRAIQQIDGG